MTTDNLSMKSGPLDIRIELTVAVNGKEKRWEEVMTVDEREKLQQQFSGVMRTVIAQEEAK